MSSSWRGTGRIPTFGNLVVWGYFLFLLSVPVRGSAAQTDDSATRLQNSSDWWSITRNPDSGENVKPQEREIAKSNFQVLGVNLSEFMFGEAAAKLGKANFVQRGDASTGRRQACYVSADAQDKVYLVFEQGEVEFTFYLFAGGLTWDGADQCIASRLISRSLATGSGLHLGQTPAQLMAILGKPTRQRENELVYSFLVRKKTSPQDLEAAKRRHPELSNKDFQDTYGTYNLGTGIDAKFVGSKLTYLAISKAESN